MAKILTTISLIVLLFVPIFLEAKQDGYNDTEQGNPAFEKYKKYGLDFPERFSEEVAEKNPIKYNNPEKEKDYQDFARLMRQIMDKSEKAMQDASDFQERFDLEKSGRRVERFNDVEKEKITKILRR